MKFTTSLLITATSLLTLAPLKPVEAHGKLVNPEDLNVQLNKGIPLISRRDVTRIRRGQHGTPCGRFQNGNGDAINLATADMTPRMIVRPRLTAQIEWFQQDKDGAGPLEAAIDATGTGNNFQATAVSRNIPGQAGINTNTSRQTLHLTVDIPHGLRCFGPNGACLLRVNEPAWVCVLYIDYDGGWCEQTSATGCRAGAGGCCGAGCEEQSMRWTSWAILF
ncbi:hypothetical protein HK102_014214 [Quaeritorhiza haematococci]|nr:hypothetical protein HK102_014214 [Quaeritorhiza haematococci]